MAKNYNRQLIRRKYIQSSQNVPQFGGGGFLKGHTVFDKVLGSVADVGLGAADAVTNVFGYDPITKNDYFQKAGQRLNTVSNVGKAKTTNASTSALTPTAEDTSNDAYLNYLKSKDSLANDQAANLAASQKQSLITQQVNTELTKPVETDNSNYNELKTMSFRHGGLAKPKKYYMGGDTTGTTSNAPNAELEKAEPFMTPGGNISNVSKKAPTHEEGGVKMNLPEGTKIIGKTQQGSDELKEAGIRLSKLQKKFDKIIEERPTQVDRNTAERMIKNATIEFQNIFMQQEISKMMAQQPANTQQSMPQQQMPTEVQPQNITQ